jgi:hypothetical protein
MLFEVKLVSQASADCVSKTDLNKLERRLGGFHAKQRLGIGTDPEGKYLATGSTSFT